MEELNGTRIAVVDDDLVMRKLLAAWLSGEGHEAVEFDSGSAALEGVDQTIAAICLDLGLGDIPGMDVLRALTVRFPDIPIIVVTARKDVEVVVEAMRAGAYDYLAKPLTDDLGFRHAVRRAVGHHEVLVRMHRLEDELGERSLVDTLAAQSGAMREVVRSVERVRDAEVNVAIMGESGTGKEVVARAIHGGGNTRGQAFVAVNCAAIPHSLQESELFGHEKGSFTGATATHRGKFEQASAGTLFLDEVGEMAPATQASLLRVLQERAIVRVGGRSEIPVNARVICATHRDLAAEVRAGRFREDLYFRLVVYPIRLPALRERIEDLPLLVAELLGRSRIARDRGIRSVSAEALDALASYRWPGNIRELDNVLQRAALACDTREIAVQHLPPEIQGASRRPPGSIPARARTSTRPAPATAAGRKLREIEINAVREALDACGGNITQAAKLLGVSRTKLYRDLKAIES